MDKPNQRKELENALHVLQGSQEVLEEGIKEMNKLLWFRYQDLIRNGFSEVQAFTVILQRGIS